MDAQTLYGAVMSNEEVVPTGYYAELAERLIRMLQIVLLHEAYDDADILEIDLATDMAELPEND